MRTPTLVVAALQGAQVQVVGPLSMLFLSQLTAGPRRLWFRGAPPLLRALRSLPVPFKVPQKRSLQAPAPLIQIQVATWA